MQIGAKGVTEQVIQSAEEAILARELIKISIASPLSDERKKDLRRNQRRNQLGINSNPRQNLSPLS